MVSLKVSNFENNNVETYNNIFRIYSEDEHSNLSNFLEKTQSKFNIIYTFSSILEKINIKNRNGNETIENRTFNLKIKSESIYRISIVKLKSENDLDKELLNFDENRDLNVCILQFQPSDTEKMNSIKFYLENYIKENPNRKGLQKKLFVFMIHLFRIEREFKQEVKQLKIFANEEEKLKEKEEEEKEKEKEKKIKESKIIEILYLI